MEPPLGESTLKWTHHQVDSPLDGPTTWEFIWKLPGMVHTHPEVRQKRLNTAEGMQEAMVCKTSRKAKSLRARVSE